MTTELRSLDAAELVRLGGLKTQCSASLLCTEHNSPYPCEACDALGFKSAACSACLYEFPDGLSAPGERPCASQAAFVKTGRIAFEADAMAALASASRDKEAARERRKRAKEEAARERDATEARARQAQEAKARKERKERKELEDREDLARKDREEQARKLREEREEEARKDSVDLAPAPSDSESAARGDRRARLAGWASLGGSLAGAYTLWHAPMVEMPSTSWAILSVYMVVVLLVWGAGSLTLAGKEVAHASLRWWAPLAWAFVGFAWPGVAGLAVAFAFGASGLSLFALAGAIVVALGLVVIAITCVSACSVALTMKPPWPAGFLATDFKGLRSVLVWLALAATVALNAMTGSGSGRLLERSGDANRTSGIKPHKPLLQTVTTKPSPENDLRGFSRASLADIAQWVNAHPNLTQAAVTGALPRVDATVTALARLPRPAAGNRAAAKALMAQAVQMMSRSADWGEVADVIGRAHAADRQDVQILNDLAYAQTLAGRHVLAMDSVLETLRLAPTRANAWASLAQLRLATAGGDRRQIEEAARYYVVSYWFARDRQRALQIFNSKLKRGTNDFADNPAAISLALERLRK